MEKKEEIILIAADMFHEYGFNAVGIQKILNKAEIPKGSFYHYFSSKENLILEVINSHINCTKTLLDSCEKDIEGLKTFFQFYFDKYKELEYKRGCAIGNLILELSDDKESYRLKLNEWIKLLESNFKIMLDNSDLKVDSALISSVLVSLFEGVILKAKVEKNDKSIREFNDFVFNNLLK